MTPIESSTDGQRYAGMAMAARAFSDYRGSGAASLGVTGLLVGVGGFPAAAAIGR